MFDEEKRLKQCETIGKEMSEGTLENVSGGSYEEYTGEDEGRPVPMERCPYCDEWLDKYHFSSHLVYYHPEFYFYR